MKAYLLVDIFRYEASLLHMLNTSIGRIHHPLLLEAQLE
jgi:hypothetical protein